MICDCDVTKDYGQFEKKQALWHVLTKLPVLIGNTSIQRKKLQSSSSIMMPRRATYNESRLSENNHPCTLTQCVLSALKKEHTWTHVLWNISSPLIYNVCSCAFSSQIKTQSTPLPRLVWTALQMQKKWMLTDQFTGSGEGNWPTSQCTLLENNMIFGWTKCIGKDLIVEFSLNQLRSDCLAVVLWV